MNANADSRTVTNVAVGYMCFGLALIVGSLADVGWYTANFGHGIQLLRAFALLNLAFGLLAYWNRQAFDAITFIAGGASTWTFQAAATMAAPTTVLLNVTRPVDEPLSYQGWFFFCWAVFFTAIWWGSMKAGALRQFILATTALSFLLAAPACWFAIAILQPIVGWVSIASGIVAIGLAVAEIRAFGKEQNPNGARIESSRS